LAGLDRRTGDSMKKILGSETHRPLQWRMAGWIAALAICALAAGCGGGSSSDASGPDAAGPAPRERMAMLAAANILPAAAPCESLLAVTLETTLVTAAVFVPAVSITGPDGTTSTDPAYCKVRAVATPVPGSMIDIEVRLPIAANWNGRFLGLGNGGYGGAGTLDLIMSVTGMAAVREGFAVASTDMGTTPSNIINADVLVGQPQRWIDFGHRATYLMTKTAKSLVMAHYGSGPKWSYFKGGSSGGQQAMMLAQRHPEEYDGILAHAPAANRTHLHTSFIWNYNALNATPSSRFTDASAKLLTDAIVAACAVKSGGVAGDAFLTDPRGCNFDPGVLQCTASRTTDCLHADQVMAARKIYGGTRGASTNELVFPGYAMGSEADGTDGWVKQGLLHEPPFASLFKWVFGPLWTSTGYDFDGGTELVDSVLADMLNANSPHLDAFKSRGGKLLRVHGWADPIIPPQDSINAYNRTVAYEAQKNPGRALQRTQEYYRLFMVPSLNHGAGGPGPTRFGQDDPGVTQPLSSDGSRSAMIALQRWVEGGIAPERFVATKYVEDDPAKGVQMTRPLCLYPKISRYKGSGPTNDASSFTCETSPFDGPEYNPTPAAKYMR
jgi:feruloyl esterase